ncbi:hypothetical protein [Chitinasiproducens palmae]|uniref:Uncharacterized protein n=1 Tax=Chitinasiproducens palmae TaxID=1770053 RepID=A0A1H2PSM4_9BURK|nr:hypothetical protein [Chitinasiproducens palmae]SDV49989.1 hypothetical protein SAMN05216551_11031 [Chitinasiproducens palmae]
MTHTAGSAARREAFEQARLAEPTAGAHLLPVAPSTTPATAPIDDVDIAELDFSCVTERANLSAATVLRQIARTLRSPLSALATESQVVYFHYLLGRCPTPAETVRCGQIFGAVDIVMGQLLALMPGAQTSVLLQNFGSTLLRMIAEDLDGLAPDPAEASSATENLAFLARSVVAASPRDAAGRVIPDKLTRPANTRFEPSGAVAEIGGERWRLSFRDGRFVASRNGRTVDVEYAREAGTWELHDPDSNLETLQVRPLAHTRAQLDQGIADAVQLVAFRGHRRASHEGAGTLYYVQTDTSDESGTLCARIHDRFVPVRLRRDGLSYEAYDVTQAAEPGYPVRPAAEDRWVFGRPVEPQAEGDGPAEPAGSGVSDRLRDKIPQAWLAPDLDPSRLSSPNSLGIMKLDSERWYLPVAGGFAPIKRHALHAGIYEIGPPDSDKVLCIYDEGHRIFRLAPEEASFEGEPGDDPEWVGTVLDAMVGQQRIARRFAQQRKMLTYREGFRTWEARSYPTVLLVDETLVEYAPTIVYYGLDRDELAVASQYAPVAKKLKATALNSASRVHALDVALRDPARSQRLFDRFFALIGTKADAEAQNLIKVHLLDHLGSINRFMNDLIDDACRRIWLVKFTRDDILGLTFKRDPLKRVFIDVEKSDAHREQAAACAPPCNEATHRADVATMLHEVSHLAADTDDVFYLSAAASDHPLAAEIQRLSEGRIGRDEARYLLKLARAQSAAGESEDKLVAAATRLFNTKPDIRARLLLDNADSLAQIVLELSEGDLRRRARQANASMRDMRALLSAFISQALRRGAA